MVTEVSDSSLRVVALFDGSFVSLVDVIMEGVLKGDGVVLLGTLNSNNKWSNDGFVGTPSVRDQSGGIE